MFGKIRECNLQIKYSQFLENEHKHDNKLSDCVSNSFPIRGIATNLLGVEFLQRKDVKVVDDHQVFKNKQELSQFLQNIHKTHAISIPTGGTAGNGSAITWDEWNLLASSMNPKLKEVCK